MQVSEVAELCYTEGFRDKNLITMVAIAGAETRFDEAFDDGFRFGLFALKPTHLYHDLLDPNISAHAARGLYEEKYFTPWASWATNKHYEFIKPAIVGVGEFFYGLYEREKCA